MSPKGRPPLVEGDLRRSVGISLSESERAALRDLSDTLGEPQGAIVGRLILAERARVASSAAKSANKAKKGAR